MPKPPPVNPREGHVASIPRGPGASTSQPKVLLAMVFVAMNVIALIPFGTIYWARSIEADIGRNENLALQLASVLSMMQDVETGQRGFVITGREEFLEPYRSGLERLQQARPALRRDMSAEIDSHRAMSQLDHLIDSKLDELSLTVALRRSQGFSAVEPIVTSAVGKKYMDGIRTIIAKLTATGDQRKGALLRELQRRKQVNAIVGFAAAFMGMLCLGVLILTLFREIKARRYAEQKAEKNFHFLAESVPQMVWTAKSDGNADYYNQRWFAYTGMTLEQTQAGKWGPIHPDDVQNSIRAWSHSVRTGEPYQVEHRFRRVSDGTYRWHLCKALPLWDEHGAITKWFGTCTDIDDYKVAEARNLALQSELEERVRQRTAELETANGDLQVLSEELRRGNETLALAAGAAGMGVWEWDLNADTFLVDEHMYRLYGRDPEGREDPHTMWNTSIHPDDRLRLTQELDVSIREGSTFHAEFRIIIPTGEIRHVRSDAQVLRDPVGVPQRIVGINLDVTERRNAETQFRETSSLLRGVLDSATDMAIIATAPDLTIKVFNKGAEKLLGYSSAELVDHATPMVFHDTSEVATRAAELSDALGRPVFGGAVFIEPSTLHAAREWSYIRKDERRVAVSLVCSAMHSETGQLTGYLGVARDITYARIQEIALQEAMTRAEQANAAKSQFLANMSHEIRTPLNAVIGLGYLLEQTPLSDEQRSFLTKINFAGRSLLSVVNNVLDLSKIEAGELILEDTGFDLVNLIQQVGQMLNAQAQAKGIELRVRPAASLPRWVGGDEARLRQVLTNLLNNAIKFTERGQVELEVSAVDVNAAATTLRCSVRDTGIGIPPEALQRLFTPFAQADASTTRRFGGTGLGLSIARRFVELMGGKIGVTSKVGSGSEFWVEVPLRIMNAAEADTTAVGQRALQVLIIEKQSGVKPIEAIVRPFGWQSHSVTLAEEAIDRMRSAQTGAWPDVILMDGDMQDTDAVYLTARLRLDFPHVELPPTIVVLDPVDADRQRTLLQQGVNAIVAKPATSSALFNAVNATLAKRAGDLESVLQATQFDQVGVQWLPGASILVVDDSEINRQVAQHILTKQGAVVETSCNGAEALERLRNTPDAFDIVLMDVQMPEMDGNEATSRIRQELQLRALPIIALTAGALVSERERSIAAGMDEFLSKPLEPAVLIRTVRRFIEKTRGAPIPIGIGDGHSREFSIGAGFSNIDSKVVTQVFGNDTALFASLLMRVLIDFSEFALPIVMHSHDAAARKELKERVHKLRGSAGTIGATKIQHLAAAAEQALEDNQPADSVEAILEQVAAAFTALGEEARPLLDAQIAKDATALPASTPVNESTIGGLLTMLDSQNLDAMERFNEIAASLSVALGKVRFAHLREAMDGLEFSIAAELIRASTKSNELLTAQM